MDHRIIQMFTHPDRQILQFITEGLELLDQHASTKGNFEKVLRIREIKAEIEELVPQSNNGRRKYIN